jgi:hypothetical protein
MSYVILSLVYNVEYTVGENPDVDTANNKIGSVVPVL